MDKFLRGMLICVALYLAAMVLISCAVIVFGGNIYQIPMGVFIGVGVISGLLSTAVNDKID